ncbi:hypothetical protein ACIOWG_04055 [Streptomyces sp. NPDC087658]|uniref:hypothetical protein n=1 Tax=Streptomyces sp. NPDC087658 TaxID=3365800 RepID=UPI00380D404A
MEQRIDPNIQPEYTVGTDPAYVPGLLAAPPAGAKDTDPERSEAVTEDEAVPEAVSEAVSGNAKAVRTEKEQSAEEEEKGKAKGEEKAKGEAKAESEDAAEDTVADVADGPVFEVSDRRGSITADRDGIRFRLDEEEADFRWDELGAVEVNSPRFARRFTVTAHLSTRRWFTAEVEAPARSTLKEWTAELDTVLDAYFEES